jgi:hypothetical protein
MTPTPSSPWHLVVQGKPSQATAGPILEIQGKQLPTIDLQGTVASTPLPVSFDAAFEALQQLDLFIEGDGSFCWTAPEARWRIFGELYDGGERLHYAELKGDCPAAELQQVLAALGHKQGPVMIQLVRAGVYLEVADFVAWAFGSSSE